MDLRELSNKEKSNILKTNFLDYYHVGNISPILLKDTKKDRDKQYKVIDMKKVFMLSLMVLIYILIVFGSIMIR